jgi:hypothetical protein
MNLPQKIILIIGAILLLIVCFSSPPTRYVTEPNPNHIPYSIAANSSDQLTVNITPVDATDQAVYWTSDNTAVATVGSNGIVTGLCAGTANITATTVEGGLSATSAVTVTQGTTGFSDLQNYWAKEQIADLVARGAIKGVTPTEFMPDAYITRAQFVTMLAEDLNLSLPPGTGPIFTDVPAGAWYHDSVSAAVYAGLVSGYGGGQFDPDDLVTREQMATMAAQVLLTRQQVACPDPAATIAILAKYQDQGSVDSWARSAVALTIEQGIIHGMTVNTLAPQARATRAEAAVVIWELNKLLEVGTDSANVNTITLNLVPQNGSPGMQAVPPIIGTTSLTLPLYPDAISTSQEFSMPFEETPGSWYVRVAKADYITSTGLTNLEAWYVQHMNDLGYQQDGNATTGNLKTGVSTQGIIFKPNQQPQGHSIEVDLSFQYFKGQTLLEYWVTDLVVPPRPATNFIPGDVTEIDGSITVYGTKVTQLKVHITDITKIQSLVSASNSLNQVIQGVNPGGPMIWGTAELVFHTSAGEEIPVDIDTDSVSVNGVGLQDYGGTVWKVLASIYGINGPN